MKQTVWISKYALSEGIKALQADVRDGKAFPGPPFSEYVGFVIGKDAHLSQAEAVAAADVMAKKKIASLRKQIAKLELVRF